MVMPEGKYLAFASIADRSVVVQASSGETVLETEAHPMCPVNSMHLLCCDDEGLVSVINVLSGDFQVRIEFRF
jgi:hypothetical protein